MLDGTVIAKKSLDLLSIHKVRTRSQGRNNLGLVHPKALIRCVLLKMCDIRELLMARRNAVVSVIGYGDVPRQFLTRNSDASTRPTSAPPRHGALGIQFLVKACTGRATSFEH